MIFFTVAPEASFRYFLKSSLYILNIIFLILFNCFLCKELYFSTVFYILNNKKAVPMTYTYQVFPHISHWRTNLRLGAQFICANGFFMLCKSRWANWSIIQGHCWKCLLWDLSGSLSSTRPLIFFIVVHMPLPFKLLHAKLVR